MDKEQCTIITEWQEIKLTDFKLPLKLHTTPQKARSITDYQVVNIICNSVSAHSRNLQVSQLWKKKGRLSPKHRESQRLRPLYAVELLLSNFKELQPQVLTRICSLLTNMSLKCQVQSALVHSSLEGLARVFRLRLI